MPITRTSMNTTGLLRTIDDEAKVVELPEDDAMARLPKLYTYYEKLEAEIRKAELDIGRLQEGKVFQTNDLPPPFHS